MQKTDLSALLKFLDFLSEKGLMKSGTASSRKAIANKVIGSLGDEDKHDVLQLDVDDVISRFYNLQGSNYTPDTLRSYKSKLNTTLADFASYTKDPLSFRPTVQSRSAKSPATKTVSAKTTSSEESPDTSSEAKKPVEQVRVADLSPTILPIPIRADLTIKIQGLPFDLTQAEANKLAGVIKAMAVSE